MTAANFLRSRLPDAKLSFEPSAHLTMLFAGSVGSVGLLKQWFERALYRAVAAGRSLVTLLDLQSERMDIGKLEKIAQENIDGLEEMALLRGSAQHLHQMLGLVPTPPAELARTEGIPGSRRRACTRTRSRRHRGRVASRVGFEPRASSLSFVVVLGVDEGPSMFVFER